jgi:primosomal replication protein N
VEKIKACNQKLSELKKYENIIKYPLSDVRLCVVYVKKHHRCVPKDNEFRCLANGRSIKVGVALSGTIASHKTLTLVVGMTMILDDFLSTGDNFNLI